MPDTDSDGDGTADCIDGCPFDGGKVAPGVCGCGFADTDSDSDSVADCLDNCPANANADQADLDGDGEGDACDPDVDGDGVANGDDACPATAAGAQTLPDGCAIAQLAPCAGPGGGTTTWKNKGAFMSALTHAANAFRAAGLITGRERQDIIAAGQASGCGVK